METGLRMANSEEKTIKGIKGEAKFKAWLDERGLSYLYINQDKEHFASLFNGNVKRPDFLVLIDSIGIIAVDVKNYTMFNDSYSLGYEKEVREVLSFERLFRIPVWYSYFNGDDGENSWYWISALKAVEVGEPKRNTKRNEEYLLIKISEFVKIQSNDDLGKLYSQRLSHLNKISGIGREIL